jgi:branched-chain amino acid transport system substrate-binding protein
MDAGRQNMGAREQSRRNAVVIKPKLAVLLAVLLLATAAPTTALAVGDPFELNAIVSQTGPGAFIGRDEASGLAVLTGRINKSGGIAGRPVKLVIADDQSNPQTAVQLYNEIIARGAQVVLGSSLAASCNAMAALGHDGPLIYCFSPGIRPVSGGYSFICGVQTADYIAVTLRYFRQRGWKRVAMITSTDASGQDGERAYDEALALPENRDMVNVAKEHYGTTDLSVSAQVTRIKAAAPQAVFAWGTGSPLQTVLRGITDVGVAVPVSVSSSNLIYDEMRQFESVLPKELYVSALPFAVPAQIPAGALKRTVQSFNDAFKPLGTQPGIGEAIAWDSELIVVEALRKVGASARAAQLRDYIETLHDFAGVNGYYDFRDGQQRGLTAKSVIVVRWDKSTHAWQGMSKLGGLL